MPSLDADIFLGVETGSDGLAAVFHQKENLSVYDVLCLWTKQQLDFCTFGRGEKQEKCFTTLTQIKVNTLFGFL